MRTFFSKFFKANPFTRGLLRSDQYSISNALKRGVILMGIMELILGPVAGVATHRFFPMISDWANGWTALWIIFGGLAILTLDRRIVILSFLFMGVYALIPMNEYINNTSRAFFMLAIVFSSGTTRRYYEPLQIGLLSIVSVFVVVLGKYFLGSGVTNPNVVVENTFFVALAGIGGTLIILIFTTGYSTYQGIDKINLIKSLFQEIRDASHFSKNKFQNVITKSSKKFWRGYLNMTAEEKVTFLEKQLQEIEAVAREGLNAMVIALELRNQREPVLELLNLKEFGLSEDDLSVIGDRYMVERIKEQVENNFQVHGEGVQIFTSRVKSLGRVEISISNRISSNPKPIESTGNGTKIIAVYSEAMGWAVKTNMTEEIYTITFSVKKGKMSS